MATEAETRDALQRIAIRISEVDADRLAEHVVERTISCQVPDLGLIFHTRLHEGGLDPFKTDDSPTAQVRLTVKSDDLVALADDELHAGKAWATGRLKIDASLGDLLRLRRLF
jgi:predicted lipid carrier protein YhbT